jgi:acyl dehydratase
MACLPLLRPTRDQSLHCRGDSEERSFGDFKLRQYPILHGLCTFGYAGYALSQLIPTKDKTTITSIGARFSAPVYPGEALRTELWTDGAELRFRCRAVERDITVLDNGMATLGTLS